jgi:superfamily II DNA/RNA helicase
MKFSDLGVNPKLEVALQKQQITKPTPAQEQAIPLILANKDLYISAETGTGKTLAYLLPLLSKMDESSKSVQVLVVTPTHELAAQVHCVLQLLIQQSGFAARAMLMIGGVPIKRQVEKLKKKPHFVIGSVGRMNEQIKSKKLKVHQVKTIVIDEADQLLFGDTLQDIQQLIKSTLRDRQMVFVSATSQLESKHEIQSICPNLQWISTQPNVVNENIEHLYFACDDRDKITLLRKLIHAFNPSRAIVFVHRNVKAEEVADKLTFHKLKVVDISGSHDKFHRKQALDAVRSGEAQVLLASDIAARGLDIKGVTHISILMFQLRAVRTCIGLVVQDEQIAKAMPSLFLDQERLRWSSVMNES